jgi:membrane-associated phospholipid phosphatase
MTETGAPLYASRVQRVCGVIAVRAAEVMENIRGGVGALLRPPRPVPARFVPAWGHCARDGLLAAAAVALSMLFIDNRVHALASGLPAWLVDLFYEITDFGQSQWVLVPLGLLIAALTLFSPALDRMGRAVMAVAAVRLGYVFIAVGLPGLTITIGKRLIGRVRPSTLGPFAYEPFSWRPDLASFPSGHATTAFAALIAISIVFPRARAVLWAYAVLIAASRIVVDAHYTSDVIAGAACGTIGALWIRDWFALRGLGFFIATDGTVRLKPWPSRQRIKRVADALLAS